MTLKEIRDQIILDSNIAGNDMYPPLRLNNMINQAQRFVQTELNGLGMKKWETSKVTSVTQGAFHAQDDSVTFLLSELTGMLESPKPIKTIQVYDGTTLGYADEATVEEFAEITRNTYLTPTIKDAKFTRLNNMVWVSPSSITDMTAFYYDKVAELSDDTDVSEIPDEFIKQVVDAVNAKIDENEGRLNRKETIMRQIKQDVNDAFQKYLIKEQVVK
jgi:hypothetical protein